MNAAFTRQFGSPDVLEIRQVAPPEVGDTDVLVQVHAVAVTAGDLRLRAADFPAATALVGRLMFGFTRPRVPVQGTMFSGVVVQVGEGVTRFDVGDEVFGSAANGAYAEQLVMAEAGPIARKPASVSHTEAASAPYGAGTALHFLRDVVDVQADEHVLVVGGSGGVGRAAISIAKHLGAEVTAVGSASSHDLMRRLGADHVVDYRTEDVLDGRRRFDVVFDIADTAPFARARRVLAPTGRYVTLYLTIGVLWQALTSALGRGPRAHAGVAMPDQQTVETLADWLADGTLHPVVAETLPLERIADAHRLAEQGVHGDVVVCPTSAARLAAVG
ncbi:MAG: NAD(P)-dependent alcohol dehydrogenase [Myxococcales bacterium]|nr:NAD(P)-dependent alcohol dehydrogenase [Myxococcales bacterium]